MQQQWVVLWCVLGLSFLALQIYQIYAKRSPGDVHGILRSFGTDYVILEDSICYERRHSRGCRLRDLLDVANGHVSVTHRIQNVLCSLWNPVTESWGSSEYLHCGKENLLEPLDILKMTKLTLLAFKGIWE